MDKFPSTTTLWQILRKFEAGVAGGGGLASQKWNFTARGRPSTQSSDPNARQLYYHAPVLQVMGRELSSFTDLQKSLAQLGLNSGSALLRLSYRPSDQTLDQAKEQIGEYFNTLEGPAESAPPALASETPSENKSTEQQAVESVQHSKPVPEWIEDETTASSRSPQTPTFKADGSELPLSPTTSTGRPLSVFAPPSSSTPISAQTTFNPDDYTPTVEHAQSHQRMLSQSSRNIRLPTEAELAQQAETEREKLAAIKDVEVKIRFPDETAVSARFGQADSGKTIYDFVRECMDDQWIEETFELRIPGASSTGRGPKPSSGGFSVPDAPSRLLIRDLGFKGRVLLVFQWDENASAAARGSRQILKSELRLQAQKVEVKQVVNTTQDADADRGIRVDVSGPARQEGETSGEQGKKKLPKWLKGLSKK